jgi:hypothetical protein
MIESPTPQSESEQVQPAPPPAPSVPWTLLDTWIGVAVFIALETTLALFFYFVPDVRKDAQNGVLILGQFIFNFHPP